MINHKRNTAYYLSFPMVDSSLASAFKAGVSPADTAYYKDGAGAWTSLDISDTATEIGSTGMYEIDLSASELNHDLVLIKFSVSGAADTAFMFNMVNNEYVADAVWDEAFSQHNSSGTFGKLLKNLGEGVVSIDGAVNDASATTTSFVTNLAETTDNHYNDHTLVFITGNLSGQCKPILSYNGTTNAVTFDEAFTDAPADTDEFLILATHVHTINQISVGARTEMDANSTQLAAIVEDTGTTLPASIAAIPDAAAINAEVDTAISDAALATAANLAIVDANVDEILVDTSTTIDASITTIDAAVDAIKAVTDNLPNSGALTDLLADVTAILSDTEALTAEPPASVNGLLNTQFTETYPAVGAAPTLAQALLLILQRLSEASVDGTTLTVKRLNQSNTAATFTLDDPDEPSTITRTS